MDMLTDEGRRVVQDVAQRHGVSTDAVQALLFALAAGRGTQAQFNHPDLGGFGQWSQGGMVMVGDMFNQGLKARVDALCTELSELVRSSPLVTRAAPATQSQSQSQGHGAGVSLFVPGAVASGQGWPAELGTPSAVGAQNDLAYAFFPETRRLAIRQGGDMRVFDTGDHRITGVSQQQSGDQSLTFTSQHGLVRLAELAPVTTETDAAAEPSSSPTTAPPAAPTPPPAPPAAPASAAPGGQARPSSDDQIFAKIERLADLRQKNIITEAEFDAKKAELLDRL